MRSMIERLLFQYLVYDQNYSSLCQRKIPVAMIYTMNVAQPGMEARNYPMVLGAMEASIQRTLCNDPVRSLYVTDTMQFDDYAKYEITGFDGNKKLERRETEFPKDCQKAREIGALLVSKVKGQR
jgi:hypothetical protein